MLLACGGQGRVGWAAGETVAIGFEGGSDRMGGTPGGSEVAGVWSAAPVASAYAPGNAVKSGGATVTISGLNFGAYSFTASLAATGVDMCGTASWTSGTTVECRMIAATAVKTSYAKVTVGAVVGTRVGVYFTFDGTAELVRREGADVVIV